MNKKNNGIIPEMKDERAMYVPVGCGKCIECMKQKKRNWQVRLLEDIKVNKNAYFITLTFTDQNLIDLRKVIKFKSMKVDIDNEIAKVGVRRWLERIRKRSGKSCRHWLVTELGHNNTEGIHLHGLIWTDDINRAMIEWSKLYGITYVGKFVSEITVNYIVKYINKMDLDHKGYKPIVLTSSGIGKNYIGTFNSNRNKFKGIDTKESYKLNTGNEISMPSYYRNKIYTDEERELLWMQMLDKEERFVLGQKIDISENEDDYNRTLEEAREKNKRLGYGDDSAEWSFEEYQIKREKFRALNKYSKERFKQKQLCNQKLVFSFAKF